MDNANISSMLAFLNVLASELGLEDFQTIGSTRDMIPILINYISSGVLTFVDNHSHSLHDAIEVISQGLDKPFSSHLNAESAKEGDEFELAKIILALLYTFRLEQEAKFFSICENISEEFQRRIAYMTAFLDDRHRWTLFPWSRILEEFDEHDATANKENVEADISKDERPTTPRQPLTPKFLNACMALSAPSKFLTSRVSLSSQKMLNFDNSGSPVAKVLQSPRGEEVVRIYALEKELKSLREFRDQLGREKDRAEELALKKEAENHDLKKRIEFLEDRIARILPDAESVTRLQDQLFEMEEQNVTLSKSLKEARTNAGAAQSYSKNVQFELQKLEIKLKQFVHIEEKYDEAMRRLGDECELHQQTRAKFLESEERNSRELIEQKMKVRELQDALEQQAKEFKSRIEHKENEVATRLDVLNQFKERSEENLHRAEENLQKKESEVLKLRSELTSCRQKLNELLEIDAQQKTAIAEMLNEQNLMDDCTSTIASQGGEYRGSEQAMVVERERIFRELSVHKSKATLNDVFVQNMRPTRSRTFDFPHQNELEPLLLLNVNLGHPVNEETVQINLPDVSPQQRIALNDKSRLPEKRSPNTCA